MRDVSDKYDRLDECFVTVKHVITVPVYEKTYYTLEADRVIHQRALIMIGLARYSYVVCGLVEFKQFSFIPPRSTTPRESGSLHCSSAEPNHGIIMHIEHSALQQSVRVSSQGSSADRTGEPRKQREPSVESSPHEQTR